MAFLRRQHHHPNLLHLHLHIHLPSSPKTTSAQHVAARHIDHKFEKLMRYRKLYLIADHLSRLLLHSPSHSLPLPRLLSTPTPLPFPISPRHFLRHLPHLFRLSSSSPPLVHLTPSAASLTLSDSSARSSSPHSPLLLRLLSISPSHSLPLRALLRSRLPLGLPDHLSFDPHLFLLHDNPQERNTHLLSLSPSSSPPPFLSAVDRWRRTESSRPHSFPLRFPPGMKLTKTYRSKIKDWQALPYSGPYEGRPIRAGRKEMEKRAVGIVHEFLSLTVEKAIEIEQISHFRKWFGIDLNIRDLFLDHPGLFYLSTKGGTHTVFLREAYDPLGRLLEPNPVYVARRKMMELVRLGRRGMPAGDGGGGGGGGQTIVGECELSDEEFGEKNGIFDPKSSSL